MSEEAGSHRFRGTADYYAEYRPGYPDACFTLIRENFQLDGTGRLLDLGCGTGEIILSLAADVEEGVGLDPETEMLDAAAKEAEEAGVSNVRWVLGGSEDLPRLKGELGTFRLATLGRSFHWMDREATLRDLTDLVEPRGGIVIVHDRFGSSLVAPDAPEEWQQVVRQTIEKYLGPMTGAGSSRYSAPGERHEDVLRKSPFSRVEEYPIPTELTWTIDRLIGHLYSLSFCSPTVLGDRRVPFEAELRARLEEVQPTGGLVQRVRVHILLARRPD